MARSEIWISPLAGALLIQFMVLTSMPPFVWHFCHRDKTIYIWTVFYL